MKAYLGIDPGQKGGIALLWSETKEVVPYSDADLIRICRTLYDCVRFGNVALEIICCLEKVGAMPGQGVTSMFNFGKAYGYIKGVLESYDIPYQEITPQRWKKEFGLNSDKEKSIDVCRRLFPEVNLLATPKCKKPHDGMAEALLMAEYARRKLRKEGD